MYSALLLESNANRPRGEVAGAGFEVEELETGESQTIGANKNLC